MSVTFEGQIDSVLGGFFCLRGYASFSDLSSYSVSNPSYQRNLIVAHKNEMRDFLKSGSYVFFPEVILSYSIKTKDNLSMAQIISLKGKNTPLKIRNNKSSLTLKDDEKLDRIDGNHRLEAFEENKSMLNDSKVPFCIILFDDSEDDLKKKNIIFHNINFKQIPLTLEHSLNILFKEDVYSDEELKSIGAEYLITKKIFEEIDIHSDEYENLPFLKYQSAYPKTFMYNAINFLLENSSLETKYNKNSEEETKKILMYLQKIAQYYEDNYKTKASSAMFTLLLYYQYANSNMDPYRWFLDNCIHHITDDRLKPESLKILYEEALKAKAENMWKSVKANVSLLFKFMKWVQRIKFWCSR